MSESVIGERAFAQTKAVVTELTKRYCGKSATKVEAAVPSAGRVPEDSGGGSEGRTWKMTD